MLHVGVRLHPLERTTDSCRCSCPVSGQLSLRSRRCAVPALVPFPEGVKIDHVAAGYHHVLGWSTEAGQLWAWGHGGDGRLGVDSDAIQPAPVLVRSLLGRQIVLIEAGNGHTTVLATESDESSRPPSTPARLDAPSTPASELRAMPSTPASAPKSSPMRAAVKVAPQLSVSIVGGHAVINQVQSTEEADEIVSDGKWVLHGEMKSDSNQDPLDCQLVAELCLEAGRLSSQLVSMSASWEGCYDEHTGLASWSATTSGGNRLYFEGEIASDGIHGRYSSADDEGTFSLLQQGDAEEEIERMPNRELIKAVAVARHTCEGLRHRVSSFRASEGSMRGELNLAQLDKENLADQMQQLKSRAEAAESKIDAERKLRQVSDDKCDRLSQLTIGFKLREEALVSAHPGATPRLLL